MRDQRSTRAHPRGGGSSFASGVASSDHDNIKR